MGPHEIAKKLQCPVATKDAYQKSNPDSQGKRRKPSNHTNGSNNKLPYWIEIRTEKGNLYHAILQFCATTKNGFELANEMLKECIELRDWTEKFKDSLLGIDDRLRFIDFSKQRANKLLWGSEDFEIFLNEKIEDSNELNWVREKEIIGEFATPFGKWGTRGSIDLFGELNGKKIVIEIKSKEVNFALDEWKNQLIIYEKMLNCEVDSYIYWPIDNHKISTGDISRFEEKFDENADCQGCPLCQQNLR